MYKQSREHCPELPFLAFIVTETQSHYLGPPRLSTSLLVVEYKCRIKKKKTQSHVGFTWNKVYSIANQ